MKKSENTVEKLKKHFYKDFFTVEKQVESWYSRYQNNDIMINGPKLRLKQTIEWISEYKSTKKSGVVLDLGCGAGITSLALENQDFKVVGIDQSLAMVEKAKIVTNSAKTPIDFLQGDIESLPFEENSMDFVVCLGVITYLETGQNAVQEIARILKPGGVIILSFIKKYFVAEFTYIIYRNFKQLFSRNSSNGEFHFRKYSINTIHKFLCQNGLKIIETNMIDTIFAKLFWQKLMTKRLAGNLSRYFVKRTRQFPFNKFGDMYLVKAEKE